MSEKFVTIFIGLLVGVVLALGVLFGPGLFRKLQNTLPKASSITAPLPTPNNTENNSQSQPLTLVLDSPEDNSFVSDGAVAVSGKTKPGTSIILFGPADEKVATADAIGNFSASLKLEDGENEISATVIDASNKNITVTRSVTLEIPQQ